MSKEIERFKDVVKGDKELQAQLRAATMQGIVAMANGMGYSITAKDLEEEVKLQGTRGNAGAVIVWENYFIVG
ncbi:MAG: Nif11-like leader peptide family natural product precursor [Bacteroidales bacterium]|nr:Nif11-like leader peptide family natural product precursor [Lachnoclostridium sp.]MCM1384286.1 Nif11-like leader peptide family natural product precursor [Lachnoclostridium sp.]MCM1464786.1 Nif11-like leader peptide family natural product precursor [Bacteroidales bacterium]